MTTVAQAGSFISHTGALREFMFVLCFFFSLQ